MTDKELRAAALVEVCDQARTDLINCYRDDPDNYEDQLMILVKLASIAVNYGHALALKQLGLPSETQH